MATASIGVLLPTMTRRDEVMPDVVSAARHLEDLGFESAWAVDQLIAGTGVPFLHSSIALAAAAAGTSRIRLGYGVLILPLRPVVWIAKEVASLQSISEDRVLLGVGVGGDRHAASWDAAGVPRSERGRRADAALDVLPQLIAGKTAANEQGHPVRLSPGVTVPPIIVGGMADAALRRAATYGDGWYSFPGPAAAVRSAYQRLGELAAERNRPTPALTGCVMVALDGDPAQPSRDELTRLLTDPDGMFGMPAEGVDVVVTGPPAAAAERIAELAEIGAERVIVSVAGGDWYRQIELVRRAADLIG